MNRTKAQEYEYQDALQTYRFLAAQPGRLTREERSRKLAAEETISRLGRLRAWGAR